MKVSIDRLVSPALTFCEPLRARDEIVGCDHVSGSEHASPGKRCNVRMKIVTYRW